MLPDNQGKFPGPGLTHNQMLEIVPNLKVLESFEGGWYKDQKEIESIDGFHDRLQTCLKELNQLSLTYSGTIFCVTHSEFIRKLLKIMS